MLFLTILVFGSQFFVRAQDIMAGGDVRGKNVVFVFRDAPNKQSKSSTVARTIKKKSSSNEDAAKFDARVKNSSSQKKNKAADDNSSNVETTNNDANSLPILAGGILNGLTTYFEMPEYSGEILKAHAADEVKIQITVDEQGKVVSAKAKSGPTALRDAAVKAAMRASFYRSSFMGSPISVTGELIYVLATGDAYKKYDSSPAKTPPIVSGGVLNGKEISSFTDGSSGAKGEVKVQVTVDEEGKVVSAVATGGNSALYTTAVDSAKSWTFPRTMVLGNKVKVNGVIVFNFNR